jgi:hypothetical protein
MMYVSTCEEYCINSNEHAASTRRPVASRVVNQLIDYQVIAILIDYFNYQFN